MFHMTTSAKKLSVELEHTSLIHLHTDLGSPGDGAGKISDYIQMFKDAGVDYATLTDHGSVDALLQFYKACKKAGVVPGLGCEFYLNDNRDVDMKKKVVSEEERSRKELLKEKRDEKDEDDNPDDMRNNHLICVAKNENGIKSIIRINNEAVMHGFKGKPRTTTEKFFEMADDVIVSTACLAGIPARLIMAGRLDEAKRKLSEWKERFKDDFYIELQINEMKEQDDVNTKLLEMAKELKIKPIIAQDCHYVDEGDDFLQLIKMLNRTRRTLKDIENGIPEGMWVFTARELFVKTNDSLISAAKRLNCNIPQKVLIDCMINNHEWKYKTRVHWDLSAKHYNKFQPPAGFESSVDYFVHLLKEGFRDYKEKGYLPAPGHTEQEYIEQLQFEMNMLIEKDFVDYLLETKQSMDDVVERLGGSRLHLGPGRGSVNASLCAFLIGITKIDPIRHRLLFFRFLSESRSNEVLDIEI